MNTRVLKSDEAAIREAAELIRAGALVGIPTETVYGLGADALNSKAVSDIFEAKGRPGDNPLIVHICKMSELAPLICVEPDENARRLMAAYWPGPMTLIFPKSAIVPDRTSGGLDTVAIRMPAHPVARRLIELSGIPIAAPSGNRSGRPSPTTAAHMLEDMDGRIPLILDGGSCEVGVESTVIDMTGDIPHVLRPGGVTPEMITAVCGACEVDGTVMRPLGKDERPRSPGMKYRHYAPTGQVTIFRGTPEKVITAITDAYDTAVTQGHSPLILTTERDRSGYGDRRCESLGKDAASAAQAIFGVLRDADTIGADIVLAEAIGTDGIGLAVMNRLGRAAAFNIIEV